MNHLSPDERIDAVEDALEPERRAHLDTCEVCRREVAGLALVLNEARTIEAPEPSPMFWEHFSARVRTAIESEPPSGRGWWPGLAGRRLSEGWWLVLAPIGALALLVAALMPGLPRESGVAPPSVTVASESRDLPLGDEGWKLVAELVGDIDWDTADAAGVSVRPGVAEQAALDLSAQEQQELRRLLKAELERVKS